MGWRADEPERGGKPRKLGVRGKHTPPKFRPYISSVLGLKLSLKLRRRDAIGPLIVNTGCRVLRMLRRSNDVSMTSPKERSGRSPGHDVILIGLNLNRLRVPCKVWLKIGDFY